MINAVTLFEVLDYAVVLVGIQFFPPDTIADAFAKFFQVIIAAASLQGQGIGFFDAAQSLFADFIVPLQGDLQHGLVGGDSGELGRVKFDHSASVLFVDFKAGLSGEVFDDSDGLASIDSIKTVNLSQASGSRFAVLDLEITFKKLSKALEKASGTQRKVAYRIPLQVVAGSGATFGSCYFSGPDSMQKNICQQLGGTYDSAKQKCQLGVYGKKCRDDPASKTRCTFGLGGIGNNSRCESASIEPSNVFTVSCPWDSTWTPP